MSKNKSGKSAYGVATLRLIEQYQPKEKRLFNDPVIQYLLPHSILSLMKVKIFRKGMSALNDLISKGIYGWLMCRTKYIDLKTQTVLQNGIQQLIIPGAGLDTRASRLEGIDKIKVFEIDLAAVQEFKKERVIRQFGLLPSHVTYVPIDFSQQNLHDVLSNCQFDFSKPTLAIWEGVSQYLSREAVEKIFDFFSKMPEGSYVLFTYVLESVITELLTSRS